VEDLLTAEWIISRLESDTGAGGLFDPARSYKPSGAYFGVIPPGADLPAVRFHVQAPNDVRGSTNPSARIMVNLDWLIVLVFQGKEMARNIPLVVALDKRLQKANGVTSQVRVDMCIRLSPYSLTEPEDSGVVYRHAGGLYRTVVQAL
jgi:hypothetical protein